MRLIETETGRIQAMVTATFETSETLDRAVTQLSRTLLTQVRQKYPLQGRIARLDGGSIQVKQGTKADAIGKQVAQSVYGGMKR